ncbi:PAS-domain containing protein [Roseicella aquatilis]|uniref:histidine kinase n=1 Tax=Roseicella aquatilis TaxID=2527868 RepID=A0A4R4DQ60_9PROT|nr:PAS-domain containing protein [Roseicella aquatilis]TCZ63213.1 response regulator [Roseicella aquatilis]
MQSRRFRLAVDLSCGLLLLTILVGTTLLLDQLQASAELGAQQMVRRVTRVAESNLNRQFLAVDGTLAGLSALLGQVAQDDRLDRAAASRMLRDLNFQNLNFRDLIVLDPEGRPWASALAGFRSRPPPLDPARLAEAKRGGSAIVSGPTRNPLTGEWSLFFLRAIDLPPGRDFVGVAEVPLSLLGTMLAPIGEAPGLRLSVERSDGELLATIPHDETRIGRSATSGAPAPPRDGNPVETTGRFTGRPALVAARPMLYRDILVTASLDLDTALAEYRQDRQQLLVVAAGSALLIGALGLALNLALRQRARIEAERAAARGLLESAIESLPDGFVMFDAEDRLVVCNQRYRDLYAVSAPFILPGARLEDIIREGARRGQYPQAGEDIEAFVAAITAWHRGDQPSLERLLPDGRWILVTERRTPDGGTVGIRTDITDLKRTMTELARARDTAAAATEAKSRFLARMSHELRTPLNGVLGLAQALARDPALSGEQRRRAATLEAAGRHLVAVANDVLDLAKVEAGLLELRLAPADLPSLLRACLTMTQPAAEAKGVSLALDLAPGLPPLVETDHTRLRQVLLNLLSNAVKFTPSGGQVRLAAAPRGPAGADGRVPVRIEVRDTGPGVPESQRSAIFGDFVQLERGGEAGGSGLGLAIAAGLTARMGGRIGCDDNADWPGGIGAVFWVELPLRPAAAPQAAATAPAAAPGRTLRVLVADDVPVNLAVARALLEVSGHRVECVPDGAQAVRAVAEADPPFDAVLMDVMMPGMDGLEATRRIRALPGAAGRVPILAVTASAFSEEVEACIRTGMDAHIAKPIERETLLAALARVTAATAPATPAGGLDRLPLLRREAGEVPGMSGLEPALARSIAGDFVRELRDAARSLREADAASVEQMLRPAHRLAGAAGTLRAPRLAEAAHRFQAEARRASPEAVQRLREGVLSIAEETLAAFAAAEMAMPG